MADPETEDEIPGFAIEEDLPDPNEELEFGDEEGKGGEAVEPAGTPEVAAPAEGNAPPPSPPTKQKPPVPKAEQRIGQLTRKLREAEAKLQQRELELQAAAQRVTATEESSLKAVASTLTKNREALIGKFRQAFEEGKTDEVTETLQELMVVDRQLSEVGAYSARAVTPQPAAPTPPPSSPPAPPPVLQDWMDRVNFADLPPEDKQIVGAVAAKLEREGYDFRTKDFYTHLDSRLGGLLSVNTEDEETPAKPAPTSTVSSPRPTVAGPSRRPVMSGSPPPANKVTVSREAVNRLGRMGIDLSDKAMREAYLKYGKGIG